MDDDHLKNDDHLRQKARHLIQAGKLPHRRADRTFGGPGVGDQCAICEEPVTRDELEIELEFTRDGGLATSQHHVHVHCFSILELERQRGGSAIRPPGKRRRSGAAAGANGRGSRSPEET